MQQRAAAVGVRDGARTAEEAARGVFAAIDAHDLDAVGSYFHPDDVEDFVPVGLFRGRGEVVGFFAELFEAFPDMRMTVEHVLADEQEAVVRWRLGGTFTGAPFQGIRPTGAEVHLRGVDAFIEVRDGLITYNTIFYDGAAFARDIGLLPARGSRAERILLAAFNLRTRLRALRRRRD